ncbi:MAG: FKBP-type peptidyl-prolyl cis-trans isomerase [Ferruginibacter sp.]
MRKHLSWTLFLLVTLITGGCLKSDTNDNTGNNCVPNTSGVPTAAEMSSLQSYLSSHSITATLDSRGFYYIILNPGSGTTPVASSNVTVKYTGTLENGTIFDQNLTGAAFPLSQLIKGWQYGLGLIQKGGSIKLFLPPTLGYGCNALPGVPAGSNLIFSIDLIDVQ